MKSSFLIYHLGNVRVSYTKDKFGDLKILEENHYYPFGLRHEVYFPSSRIRDFRAAEGLNGGQIGDPVELVNVTKTEYMYKFNDYGGKSFEKNWTTSIRWDNKQKV